MSRRGIQSLADLKGSNKCSSRWVCVLVTEGLARQQTFKQNRPTKAAKKQETASCVGHGAVSAGVEQPGLWRMH